MKIGRYVYNTLNELVRKGIAIMRLRRDGLLIVLSLIVGALVVFLPTKVIDTKDSLSSNILSLVVYVIGIIILVGIIVVILKSIKKIDKKEAEDESVDKAKLNAIIKKLGITQEEINREKPKQTKKGKRK